MTPPCRFTVMAAPSKPTKDDAKDPRLEMLRELAKLTKPTGNSAKGKAIEGKDDDE